MKLLISQQDQIDQVAIYITKLREKVDDLNNRKEIKASSNSGSRRSDINHQIEIQIVKVREIGSSQKFSLQEIVRILEEEGAEVIIASTSTIGLHMYHILHAQVTVLTKPFLFQNFLLWFYKLK
ncbi:hypothetical protein M9H77_17864 [Catharanthus roseus]|uniref:Uncharacterized protein n=1 Tax=Catharanthus roseus TaxID=4058 RepID=A0ACC0B5T3_CATRO|nr:hypothetical protein M9H77_17864 [Catharanthus roseus]